MSDLFAFTVVQMFPQHKTQNVNSFDLWGGNQFVHAYESFSWLGYENVLPTQIELLANY